MDEVVITCKDYYSNSMFKIIVGNINKSLEWMSAFNYDFVYRIGNLRLNLGIFDMRYENFHFVYFWRKFNTLVLWNLQYFILILTKQQQSTIKYPKIDLQYPI